jgi:hypothetical protein
MSSKDDMTCMLLIGDQSSDAIKHINSNLPVAYMRDVTINEALLTRV